MAAHRSGRAPLRSDPGVAAGAEPSGYLEADRRQPRQTRAESRSALPRTRPFDSWQQIRSLAVHLGRDHGPMILFAAATGLRPCELFALEHRDIDRGAGVLQIRRAYANGRV